LTNKIVNATVAGMIGLEVIDDPSAATVALDPVRSRLLAELAEPASAAGLAGRVGLARQKVNYHLRQLEAHGLVRVASKRQWGGLTERLLVATAASYVVSPAAMGPVAADPDRENDRLSASYLIAVAARVIREMGRFLRLAQETGKRLPTLSIDAEVRFRSPGDRAAFSQELTEAVNTLVFRYHDAAASGGRRIGWLPSPTPNRWHPRKRHHHEPEKGCIGTSLDPGRSRGAGYARRSLACDRDRAGDHGVVRSDRVRRKGRHADLAHDELRPRHGCRGENHPMEPAAPIRRGRRARAGLAVAGHRVDRRSQSGRNLHCARGTQPLRQHRRLGQSAQGHRAGLARLLQDSPAVPDPLSRHVLHVHHGDGAHPGPGGRGVEGRHRTAGARRRHERAGVEGAGRLGGTVEEILENDHMRSVLVRLDAPAPGVASVGTYNCGGPIQVCLSLYLYGDRAPAAITRDQALWQTWLNERFPAEAPASGMS
jgi:DNA-binding transcriptional ArsR family regulator